jgi:thiaminase
MALHLDYCASFGLSKEQVENCKEAQGRNAGKHFGIFLRADRSATACTAYSRYILDVGQSEDWLALQVALAPCLIGYGEIARQLHRDERSVRTGNRYWKWVENYVADDYSQAVVAGTGEFRQFKIGCCTTLR